MGTEGKKARRHVIRAVFAVTFLAFSFLALSAGTANAAAKCSVGNAKNPDGSPDLTGYLQCQFPAVTPNPAEVGATVTVNGGGFEPGSDVTVTLECPGHDAVVLDTVVADDAGNVLAPVVIPSDTSPGACEVKLTGVDPSGEPLTVVLAVTLTAAGTTTTGSLPVTGSDVGQYVGLGVALIALGGAAVWGARRERTKRAA